MQNDDDGNVIVVGRPPCFGFSDIGSYSDGYGDADNTSTTTVILKVGSSYASGSTNIDMLEIGTYR